MSKRTSTIKEIMELCEDLIEVEDNAMYGCTVYPKDIAEKLCDIFDLSMPVKEDNTSENQNVSRGVEVL